MRCVGMAVWKLHGKEVAVQSEHACWDSVRGRHSDIKIKLGRWEALFKKLFYFCSNLLHIIAEDWG
jgi:hypothetical protein